MSSTDRTRPSHQTPQLTPGRKQCASSFDPFADKMNAMRKYVVSATLAPDDLTWTNTTLVPPDGLIDTVRQVRSAGGGDVQVMGSATLARTLISNDLVDEYNLMIEPVVLGGASASSQTTAASGPSSWCR